MRATRALAWTAAFACLGTRLTSFEKATFSNPRVTAVSAIGRGLGLASWAIMWRRLAAMRAWSAIVEAASACPPTASAPPLCLCSSGDKA
jgi:hypothetical protein